MPLPAFRATLLVTLAVPLLAGCGGGGGGDGNAGAPPLQSRLRALQPGDHFGYAISVTVRATDGSGDSVNLSGTATTDVTATEVVTGGRTAVKETFAVRVPVSSGDPFLSNSAHLFTFDPATSDQYAVGAFDDRGNQYLLESPVRYAPGTFTAGTQFHETGRFPDGSSADEQFTVGREEVVSVPAGRFATWRCTRVDNGYRSTEWYAPQLGGPVKLHLEDTSDGVFTTMDFKMNDTNIPH